MIPSLAGGSDRDSDRDSGGGSGDVVADVVAATRRRTAVYCQARLRAPWGIGVPAGAIATVHAVTAGTCWFAPADGDPVRLSPGDVVLVPSGRGHTFVDRPGRRVRPMGDLIGGLGTTTRVDLDIDGDGPPAGLLCGGFLLAAGPRHPITDALPPVVHIGAGRAEGSGLAAAVGLLAAEVTRADPGAAAVVASLVDLLFALALRTWLADQRHRGGWAHALYDPVVGGALALVHADPARPWSVDGLARAVGAPSARLRRRFTALTGQPPMAYVTAWRMTVAARLLRQDRAPLREVARRVGYESEYAFARAFKRAVGVAPGRYRAAVDSR